jgi:hypothetical protein
MSDPVFKLQLLARAELTLTQIYARRAAAKTGYLGVAMVLCLLGLGMLNLSAFLALQSVLTPAGSAFALAATNGFIAAAVLLVSRKAGPSESEEKLARDIRDMAYREVSEDVEEVKQRLDNLGGDVRAMGENVSRATGAIKFLVGLISNK